MEATAIMYGGEIVKKLEDTDWIILGTRPGDNKVKEINEKGLKTMSEDDFFEMVKGGGEPAESAGPPKKKLKA
jgi:BRCT domain type II-containing protein